MGGEIRNPRDLFHSALTPQNGFYSEMIPRCRSHFQSHLVGLWAENGELTGEIKAGSSLRDPECLRMTHQTNQSLAQHTHTELCNFYTNFARELLLDLQPNVPTRGGGFAQLPAGIPLLPGRCEVHFKKIQPNKTKTQQRLHKNTGPDREQLIRDQPFTFN